VNDMVKIDSMVDMNFVLDENNILVQIVQEVPSSINNNGNNNNNNNNSEDNINNSNNTINNINDTINNDSNKDSDATFSAASSESESESSDNDDDDEVVVKLEDLTDEGEVEVDPPRRARYKMGFMLFIYARQVRQVLLFKFLFLIFVPSILKFN